VQIIFFANIVYQMPRVNLALRPDDAAFEAAIIASAQKHFSATADGYLLTPNAALPHVTVCDFEAEEASRAELWESLSAICANNIELVCDSTCTRLGQRKHEGFVWIGLEIVRSRELVVLEEKAHDFLNKKKVNFHSPSGAIYWPHITFARLKKADAKSLPLFFPDELLSAKPRPFHLTLGLSDVNGVYRRQLFP
jgi:2'-5' RNA ligase